MPPSKNSSSRLLTLWSARGPAACALAPLGAVYALLMTLRRLVYRQGWLTTERLSVPVVVVGNLIVGGAGKTPLTLWLAKRLMELGHRPGIVSRGYGRQGKDVQEVGAGATALGVGDEPLLLARRSGCPVFVGADRAAAGRALLAAHPACDLILCDDGLQHYRLWRNVEIAVLDRRGLMNGWLLPAGPLRELPRRLASVDALVFNGVPAQKEIGPPAFAMRLEGARFERLGQAAVTCTSADLAGKRLHAVAGIGEPRRFFDHLASLGLDCANHAFPDHHRYGPEDLKFDGDAILMTEKDALKCAGLSTLPIWVLPVDAIVEPDLACFILDTLEKKTDGCASA